MSLSLLLCLTLILSLLATALSISSLPPPLPGRFTKSTSLSLRQSSPKEYVEVAEPVPSDVTPSCSLTVISHTFANTAGRPPVVGNYSPPTTCPPPWHSVVLEMSASSEGEQYDRVAGVWLAGAEIFRTMTAEPDANGGIWTVRKNVTRYASLLGRSNLTVTVMLENVVDEELTGAYDVNLTLLYYQNLNSSVRVPSSSGSNLHKLGPKLGLLKEYRSVDFVNIKRKLGFTDNDDLEFESENRRNGPAVDTEYMDSVNEESKLGLEHEKLTDTATMNYYVTPADIIIPISNMRKEEGSWFRIEKGADLGLRKIKVPLNTSKAVLEVYASFHGDDEFWYSNPPDSYLKMNNLTTGRGNGAFREVLVNIDGIYAGSVIPLPVVYTGGVNPLLWEPIVGIGAFNLPTYDFDLTPFLGMLLDGKSHAIGLGVVDSIPFWLVDANLHLWLDTSAVQARVVNTQAPALQIKRNSKFRLLDGSFKIGAKRSSIFSGWVKTSAGNLTTQVLLNFKIKNMVTFNLNGTSKIVQQNMKTQTELRVISEVGALLRRTIIKKKYPLKLTTKAIPSRLGSDIYLVETNVSQSLTETSTLGTLTMTSLHNKQFSTGWMMVKDHTVFTGFANTNQSLSTMDESGCYFRVISAANGRLTGDQKNFTCPTDSS
ncbi:peptide-N4-(N-acetyl-beta-glucosaminyl) asparagine amidase A protein [Actinidia rufa]|uniref:Peptide-N4-(N-acetyl-beta-glucosaminyl) asparagine amidase A protein n=1 Tax=Actinidia rufa TaxID=165716 RepID=A0A7J0E6F3_9ERIC|nr:peptide-N4-(N-acetyl-beta-glucosaminyl) asparagine amidase A protein [Actinidia rufa]